MILDIISKNLILKIAIHDLNLSVRFYKQYLKVNDLNTKKLLRKCLYKEECDKVEVLKSGEEKKCFLLKKGNSIVHEVTFDLLYVDKSIKTKAEYILNIGVNKSYGFYCGLYEFGTFLIEKDVISIEKSVSTSKVSFGVDDFKKKLFFINKPDLGIECWDWKGSEHSIKWTYRENGITKGLTLTPKNRIIIGNKNGELTILKSNDGKFICKYQFNNESIRHLLWTDACICLNNYREIYKFNLKGDLV
ncbi:MAG: hypothetical protein HeimC3_47100 [Candidatus Heimdallarchaeota archaeon LC_3]|nr:MAG: hypothetical protein HeimC3_51220 [Candidatus Heimdallarchaeota archaeon LC_3]OLS19134.1 MAG: hypothetical protein HeimC3_47100 [Candidatus Heimdallarchaeota archaeon LC_3]